MDKQYWKRELLEFASVVPLGSLHELKESVNTMTVYTFLHNPCIWESAWNTVSAHISKAGAYRAMKKHMLSEYEVWRNRSRYFRRTIKPGAHKSWGIGKMEILP